MPNFQKHASSGALVGALTGLALNYFNQVKKSENNEDKKFDYAELFLSTFGGATLGTLGGVLPDILEPANSPHHRKVFHSWATASLISYGLYQAYKSNIPKVAQGLCYIAGFGYLSHLALDSRTPMGLPLFN